MNSKKSYNFGDKWSDDFDYDGMLKSGLKVSLKTPIKKMEDLLKSFTDVNYHSEGEYLSNLIDTVKSGDIQNGEKNLIDFKDSIKKTLYNLSEGQNPHRKKYVDVISEGRREDILNRFDENPELRKTIEEFLDHEFNKKTNYKYVNWVLKKNFDDFGNTFIPLDSVINWLEKFDKVRKNLQYKDINQYKNIHDLIDTLEVYGDTKSEEKGKLKSDTLKIYEDNDVLIVKPLSSKSSCYYGYGTRWCTSAQSGNRFDQYFGRGPLYYFIFKKLDKDNDYYKIAVHYDVMEDRMTLYDATDKVNDNLLGFLKTNPAFDTILKDIEKNHKFDESKNQKTMLVNLLRNNNFNFEKIKRYILYGQPVNILGNNDDLVIAKYGNKDIIIKPSEDGEEIIFYSSKSNILDKRPTYEMVEYLDDNSDPYSINHLLSKNTVHTNYKVIRDLFNFFISQLHEELNVGQEEVTYWSPVNSQSNYKFESTNPDNSYIKFLEYIRDRESQNEPASKRDFLINVLEKDPEEVVFSGYLSTMFSSMKDAGLVSLYRANTSPYFRYKIGPNYKVWEQGRLKRI